MRQLTLNSLVIYCFDNLSSFGNVVHAIFTRHGGTSKAPFDTLNASFAVGDDAQNVIRNREIISQALGVPIQALVVTRQIHSANVVTIEPALSVENHAQWYDLLPSADAMLTAVRQRFLLMTFADCVPVLLFDPVKQVVGIVHAGWKGTVARIAERAVASMIDTFASNPSDLVAAIGPSIGPCCYEIGDDVISAVRRSLPRADEILRPIGIGIAYLDLWEANKRQLLTSGISEQKIELALTCTACHNDIFFSHRGAGGRTGRFAVIIGLR